MKMLMLMICIKLPLEIHLLGLGQAIQMEQQNTKFFIMKMFLSNFNPWW